MQINYEINNFIQSLNTSSRHTKNAYKSDLNLYTNWLKQISLEPLSVNSSKIQEYINWLKTAKSNHMTAGQGIMASSINRRLSSAKEFYEYLIEKYPDRIQSNPVKKKHYLKIPKRLPRPVEPEVLDQLFCGVTDKRDKAMFTLYLSGGFRLDELISLNENDLILQGFIHNGKEVKLGVVRVKGKGDKERIVYIDEEAYRTYLEYLPEKPGHAPAILLNKKGGRISPRGVQDRLTYWCKKLGLGPFNVHRLRHTFATNMINNGINIEILSTLMGHESISTTQIYTKVSNEKVREAYISATNREKV